MITIKNKKLTSNVQNFYQRVLSIIFLSVYRTICTVNFICIHEKGRITGIWNAYFINKRGLRIDVKVIPYLLPNRDKRYLFFTL